MTNRLRWVVICIALLPGLLACAAAPATAQISIVQSGQATAYGTSCTVTMNGGNTAAGNLLIVLVEMNPGVTISSVTDPAKDAFRSAVGPTVLPTQGWNVQGFYAGNIARGTNTVTVTFSAGNPHRCVAAEIAGLDTVSPLDQTNSNASVTGATASCSVTTAVASEIVIAWGVSGNGTTADAGFTSIQRVAREDSEYTILSSTATLAMTFTNTSGGGDWAALCMSFKAPATVGGGTAPATPRPAAQS
jgi:hypothetical protein